MLNFIIDYKSKIIYQGIIMLHLTLDEYEVKLRDFIYLSINLKIIIYH